MCVREYQCVGEQKKGQSCKKGGRKKGGEGIEIGWGRGKGNAGGKKKRTEWAMFWAFYTFE